jgi:ketosteroid isomerase-like protein
MNMESATTEPTSPARTCLAFVRAVNRGDLEVAAACFARDGCLITPDATAIHGRNHIRPVLAQMVIHRTTISIELNDAIGAGDVVLAQQRWRVRAGGSAGATVERTLNPTLVLRRIEEEWKLTIAAPWGWSRIYP